MKIYEYCEDGLLLSEHQHIEIEGTGLPANCTNVSPPSCDDGFIQRFDGESWHVIADDRGAVYYNKMTAEKFVTTKLGEVVDLEQFTTLVPPIFDPENQHIDFKNEEWTIRYHHVPVFAYHKTTKELKEFRHPALVTDSYTIKQLPSIHHIFDSALDEWVLDSSGQNSLKIENEQNWVMSEFYFEKENHFLHQIAHRTAAGTQEQSAEYLRALIDYKLDNDAMLSGARPSKEH